MMRDEEDGVRWRILHKNMRDAARGLKDAGSPNWAKALEELEKPRG